MLQKQEKIAVIGLGYVGLPVLIACSKHYPGTTGFDINSVRITELNQGLDSTQEVDNEDLARNTFNLTCNVEDLKNCSFFIVTVPTPIDKNRQPDLEPIKKACRTIAKVISKGSVIVFESTVYPGVTEDICGPLIEKESGLVNGRDFKLGYSPERINPGDKKHRIDTIVKVVSGQDEETTERIANVYRSFVTAGLHIAPNIKTAEAAKVIENTQRDLNIALMNELAIIFDRLGIRTRDVLDAANSKWNFLPFEPGLVGGHCIGVDPYYLAACAEHAGYFPELIMSGRRINDNMGKFLSSLLIKRLVQFGHPVQKSKIGILGLTFKENVPDLRNSKVPDIVSELRDYKIEPLVHDPHADPETAARYYKIDIVDLSELTDLNALVLAVKHEEYLEMNTNALTSMLKKGGVILDIKSVLNPTKIPEHINYCSL